MVDGLVLTAAAWLATVAVHGVLIAGLVALATRGMRSGPARERAWKMALFGALVTATVQLGLGVDPLGGALVLRSLPAQEPSAAPPIARVAPRRAAPAAALPMHFEGVERGVPVAELELAQREALPVAGWIAALPFTTTALEPLFDVEAPMRPAEAPNHGQLAGLRRSAAGLAASLDTFDVARGALAAWAGIAAACLALWSLRWRRLARQVADRSALSGEPARALADLCARAGRTSPVRLSVTAELAAPITFGLVRAEICLPERALVELAPDELRAMLAHELAHVVRRDPLWLALTSFFERVLFFQPLARFARRRWQEEAELACDDLAVRWTDERLSLATCLTEVAGWLLHEPRALAGLPVPSMALAAHGRAGLGRRVRRLIDEPPTVGERGSRWIAPVCVIGLASVVAAAPRIAPTSRAVDAPEHALRHIALQALEHAAERLDQLPAQSAFGATDGLDSATVVQGELEPRPDVEMPEPGEMPELRDMPEPGGAPEPDGAEDEGERFPTPLAFAPEALHVIGPHGLAQVAPAAPEPGLGDVLRGLERSIGLLQGELRAIAGEAEAQGLDGWDELITRLEQRIGRLREQHERLAATAALLVALDEMEMFDTTTTGVPLGTPSMTLDEVNR